MFEKEIPSSSAFFDEPERESPWGAIRDSRGSAKATTLSSGITRAERLNDCKNFRRERRKWRTTPEK